MGVTSQSASGLSVPSRELINGSSLPAGTLSLTYDDGPDVDTLAISAYLKSQNIKATFFVNGCRFQGSPAPNPDSGNCQPQPAKHPLSILDQLQADGHRIANHTEDHLNLGAFPDQLSYQVGFPQRNYLDPRIKDGFYLLRAPYNSWNQASYNAIRADTSLDKISGPIFFKYAGGDFNCPAPSTNLTPAQCVDTMFNGGLAQQPIPTSGTLGAGIIQLHDRVESSVGQSYALAVTQALIPRLKAAGYRFVPLDAIADVTGTLSSQPGHFWSDGYTDAGNWGSNESYYGTVQYPDANGDGRPDVCGRGTGGIFCSLSNGTSFGPSSLWFGADFTDSKGWLPSKYGSTIQFGDINGDHRADVCGRGGAGMFCALANQSGTAFDPASYKLWSAAQDYSDASSWGSSNTYYATLRLSDINGDGKADVCGRSAFGILCSLSNGSSFAPQAGWQTDFSNAANWNYDYYARTIQFADINGDGKADICGRGIGGMVCGLSNGTSFAEPVRWSPGNTFADSDGWAATIVRYGTIRLGDINADGKADVCGRDANGIACAVSTGSSFKDYRYITTANYRDNLGWGQPRYALTLRLSDVTGDGAADVCGRGIGGILCATTTK